MWIAKTSLLAALWLFGSKDHGLPLFDAEKAELQKLFGEGRYRPAEYGLGPIWGAYRDGEWIRIWLNGKAGSNKVENVKLSVVVPHQTQPSDELFDVAEKLFARYAPEMSGKARTVFDTKSGYSAKPGWTFILRYRTGPNANEYIYEFQPNTAKE